MLRSPAVRLALALLLTAFLVLASGIDPGVLCLLPALGLALVLLAGRYPGELVLTGLRERPRRRAPRALACLCARTRASAVMPRGGLLIGCSLAVRPPPLCASAS